MIESLRAVLSLDISRYRAAARLAAREYDQFVAGTERGSARASRATSAMSTSLSRLGGVVRNVQRAAFALFAIFASTRAFGALVTGNAEMERMEASLTVLLGSAKAARRALAEIFTFTETTPFVFTDVAKTFQGLLAFGRDVDQAKNDLKLLGDVAAISGARLQDLGAIYGKAFSKGRLDMERVNQIIERQIPLLDELQKRFPGEDVFQKIERGEVSFRDLEQTLESLTGAGGRFEGGMKTIELTLGGLLSTLSDIGDAVVRDLGLQLFEAVKGDVTDLKDRIEELRASGDLAAWSQRVGSGIRAAYEAVRDITLTIGRLLPLLTRAAVVFAAYSAGARVAAAAVGLWNARLVIAGAAIRAFQTVLLAARNAMAWFTAATLAARNAQVSLNIAWRSTPWGAIAGALSAIIAYLVVFARHTDRAAEAQRNLADRTREVAKAVAEADGAMLRSQELTARSFVRTGTARLRQLQGQIDLLRVQEQTAPRIADPRHTNVDAERSRIQSEINVLLAEQAKLAGDVALAAHEESLIREQLAGDQLKLLGYLTAQRDELVAIARVDRSPEQAAELLRLNAQILELEKEIRAARGQTGPDGPAPELLRRMEKLAEGTRLARLRAAELRDTDAEIASVLQEIFELEDQIAALRAAAAEAPGSAVGMRLSAEADLLASDRDALLRRREQYEEARGLIRGLAEEAANLSLDLFADIDPAALAAGVAGFIASTEELLQRSEIVLRASVEADDPESLARVQQQVDALTTEAQDKVGRVLAFLVANVATASTDVLASLQDAFDSLEVDEIALPGLERARAVIDASLRPALLELARLKKEFLETGDVDAFSVAVSDLNDRAIASLQAAFAALPEDIRNTQAALDLYNAALELFGKTTQDARREVALLQSDLQLLGDAASAIADLASDFDLADSGAVRFLRSLAQVADGLERIRQLRADIARIREAGGSVSTLQTVAAAAPAVLGVAGGVASVVTGLISALDRHSDRRAEAYRAQQEELAALRERMVELQDIIARASERIASAVDRWAQQSIFGSDVTRASALAGRGLISTAREDILGGGTRLTEGQTELAFFDAVRDMVERGILSAQDAERLFAEFDAHIADGLSALEAGRAVLGESFLREDPIRRMRQFFDDLAALGIEGLDVDAYRELFDSLLESGLTADEAARAIFEGTHGVEVGLNALAESLGLVGFFSESIQGAIAAANLFARAFGETDSQSVARFVESALDVEGVSEGLKAGLLKLLDFDLSTEEGMAGFREAVQGLWDRFMSGDTSFLGDLSSDTFMALFDFLFGFLGVPVSEANDALGKFAESLDRASTKARLYSDVLGGDAAGGFRLFGAEMQAALAEMPENLRRVLGPAFGADLNSAAGRSVVQSAINTLAQGFISGLFGPEVLELIDSLSSFLKLAEEDGGTSTTSVDAVRTVTQFTFNQLAGLAADQLFYVRTLPEIARLLGSILDVLRMGPDAASSPPSASAAIVNHVTLNVASVETGAEAAKQEILTSVRLFRTGSRRRIR